MGASMIAVVGDLSCSTALLMLEFTAAEQPLIVHGQR